MQFSLERKAVSGREAGQGQKTGRGDTREYKGTEKGAESEKGTGMREGDGKESDGKEVQERQEEGARRRACVLGGLDWTGRDWFSLISQPHVYLSTQEVSF